MALLRLTQVQYSTEEQLEVLRDLVADEYDLSKIDVSAACVIIKIANDCGLYDAADFISAQMNKTRVYLTLNWRD